MTEIESWAETAVRTLRAIVADAESCGTAERQRAELRLLVDEYDDIQAGRPAWRHQIAAGTVPGELVELPAFLLED